MKKLFIVFVLMLSVLSANIDEAKKAYHTKDFKKALPMFEQLSKNGNAESNYYLGTMYGFPYGVNQDYKKAFAYYTIASNKPNKRRLKSIFNLALMYMEGWGVMIDYKKAFELLKILDDKNIGVAQSFMGFMYSNGFGRQENQKKAVQYFEKGCNSKKTYPKACYYAGDHYEQGIGVKKNYETAKIYYKKACKAGIEESCEAIKNMKSTASFLEVWLKTSWYNIILLIISLYLVKKYSKERKK